MNGKQRSSCYCSIFNFGWSYFIKNIIHLGTLKNCLSRKITSGKKYKLHIIAFSIGRLYLFFLRRFLRRPGRYTSIARITHACILVQWMSIFHFTETPNFICPGITCIIIYWRKVICILPVRFVSISADDSDYNDQDEGHPCPTRCTNQSSIAGGRRGRRLWFYRATPWLW